MYEEALQLLKKINGYGFSAYIVGGFPRDKYLGIKNDDIDICTNMTPNEAKRHFLITDETSYGTYKINNFEIAVFRRDTYTDTRYPNITYVESLDEDLLRRDFIMNTLCIDCNGNYVDKLGAIDDINNRIIRTVKDSKTSFNEDPLRIVRALRFQIDLDFNLSSDIVIDRELIKKVSKSRLNKEIDKAKNKEKLLEVINYEG